MNNILITGVSGTGKSTICKQLTNFGYKAYDIENIEGLFEIYHKGTKNIFVDYDNSKPENIKNAEWLCDEIKLKAFIEDQKSDIVFYCGIASNMDNILKFFDKVIVLQPDSNTLNLRLKNREGTNDIGNNQEGRDVVLGWKDWWEGEMYKKGAILVNANKTPEELTKEILSILKI